MKKRLAVALWEESEGVSEGLENSPNIGSVVLRTSQEINSFLLPHCRGSAVSHIWLLGRTGPHLGIDLASISAICVGVGGVSPGAWRCC